MESNNNSKQLDVIKVEENFATLLEYDELTNEIEFEFKYAISTADIVDKKITKVVVTVLKKISAPREISDASNNRQLIRNILASPADIRSTISINNGLTYSTRISDPTSKINNDAIFYFRNGIPISESSSLRRTQMRTISVEALKATGNTKSILQKNVKNSFHENSPIVNDLGLKNFRKDMLFVSGKDPSSVTEIPSGVITDQQSFSGILRPGRTPENFLKNVQTHNAYVDNYTTFQGQTLIDLSDETLVNVVDSESNLLIRDVPIRVRFKKNNASIVPAADDVFVKFEVINTKNNEIIQTITRTLSLSKYIKIYNVPIKPPHVVFYKNNLRNKANLSIKQNDELADSVNIYKKIISQLGSDSSYEFMGTYSVSSKNWTHVSIDPVNNKTITIYRCIPVKNGTIGATYTNTVIKGKYFRDKSIILTSRPIESGIILEAKNIPHQVTALYFLKKDLTLKEKNYSLIDDSNNPFLLDESAKYSDYVTIQASHLKNDHVYEFVIKCLYNDGIYQYSSKEIVKFTESIPGKISLNVQNLEILNVEDDLDIKFKVNMEITESDFDFLLASLKNSNVESYFSSDIQQRKTQLKSLLAYGVHRINLTKAVGEDLGLMVNPQFSDKEASFKNGANPLRVGESYRYIINVFMREAQTLLSDNIGQAQDYITGKNFNLNFSKFLQPNTIKNGILPSNNSNNTFKSGTTGVFTSFDVKLNSTISSAYNARAEIFDDRRAIISWTIDGRIENYDHFLIMKKVYGVATLIGRAHAQSNSNNCFWIHNFTKYDAGEIEYLIIPIMMDYSQLPELVTNKLVLLSPEGNT